MTIRVSHNSGPGINALNNDHIYIAMYQSVFREELNINQFLTFKRLLWNARDRLIPVEISNYIFGSTTWAHIVKEINAIAYEPWQKKQRRVF